MEDLLFNLNGTRDTNVTTTIVQAEVTNGSYEKLLADVWVGIVMSLLIVSCVCCMCSCILYHNFKRWKRSVLDARNSTMVVSTTSLNEEDELPSYTIVSGLPSYEEALEQMKEINKLNGSSPSQATLVTIETSTPAVHAVPTVKRIPLLNCLHKYTDEKT